MSCVEHFSFTFQNRPDKVVTYTFMGDLVQGHLGDKLSDWTVEDRMEVSAMCLMRISQDKCQNAVLATQNFFSKITMFERERRGIPYVIDHNVIFESPCGAGCQGCRDACVCRRS